MKKLVKKQQLKKEKEIAELQTFICECCGKSERFSNSDVEKKKKIDPDLYNQGFYYYIACPFCTDGIMLSQIDLIFHQMAADIFGE